MVVVTVFAYFNFTAITRKYKKINKKIELKEIKCGLIYRCSILPFLSRSSMIFSSDLKNNTLFNKVKYVRNLVTTFQALFIISIGNIILCVKSSEIQRFLKTAKKPQPNTILQYFVRQSINFILTTRAKII